MCRSLRVSGQRSSRGKCVSSGTPGTWPPVSLRGERVFVPADEVLLTVALEITTKTLGDSKQAGWRNPAQELAMHPVELGRLRRVLCRRQGGGLGDQAELSSSWWRGSHESLWPLQQAFLRGGAGHHHQDPTASEVSPPSRDCSHHPFSPWQRLNEAKAKNVLNQTLSLCKGNRSRQSKANQAKIQAETRETHPVKP